MVGSGGGDGAHVMTVFRSAHDDRHVRRALEDGLPATESCEGVGGRRRRGKEGKDRRVQLVV